MLKPAPIRVAVVILVVGPGVANKHDVVCAEIYLVNAVSESARTATALTLQALRRQQRTQAPTSGLDHWKIFVPQSHFKLDGSLFKQA